MGYILRFDQTWLAGKFLRNGRFLARKITDFNGPFSIAMFDHRSVNLLSCGMIIHIYLDNSPLLIILMQHL